MGAGRVERSGPRVFRGALENEFENKSEGALISHATAPHEDIGFVLDSASDLPTG
jgi:hypothetical protein